jgi:preprotein translocase subunit SecA
MTPDELSRFEEGDIQGPVELINQRVRQAYRQKEIKFPVSVAVGRYLTDRHVDREGLIRWANNRFHTGLTEDDFKEKERNQIEDLLLDRSRSYFPGEDVFTQVDAYLERADDGNGHRSEDGGSLRELIDFANREFQAGLQPDSIQPLDRDHVRQAVLQSFEGRFRPELGRAERDVLLEVLDHAWKEHLYYMDHLRQGIGLVGYAQKDPKVEYKREGMKAFEQMWDRIGEQVTGAIFRLEKDSMAYVGSLWAISGATHQQAASAAQEARQQAAQAPQQNGNQLEPGQQVKTVEPIRNRTQKVDRNAPCPCGSGKKYKKCCGAGMA